MPYISVNHSLKTDHSAHSFNEPFTATGKMRMCGHADLRIFGHENDEI